MDANYCVVLSINNIGFGLNWIKSTEKDKNRIPLFGLQRGGKWKIHIFTFTCLYHFYLDWKKKKFSITKIEKKMLSLNALYMWQTIKNDI